MLTSRGTRTCQGASKYQYCPYITTIVPNITTHLGVNVTGKVPPPATFCQKKTTPDFEVVPFVPAVGQDKQDCHTQKRLWCVSLAHPLFAHPERSD